MQLHFVGLKTHIHVNSSNFEYYDSWQIMRNSSKELFSIFVPEMMMNIEMEREKFNPLEVRTNR